MSKNKDQSRLRKISQVAVAALFACSSSIDAVLAQTPPGLPPAPPPPGDAQAPAKVYSLTDLEYLLGPIALYPDPLVALILPASTFPTQIVQADRWLSANEAAVKNNDFSGADTQSWNQAVVALTRFPEVLQMMSDHLDWTESLGSAFMQQPQDVANAIQSLRAQAQKVGNLQTTPQQVVTVREEAGAPVIFIEPATPERIYVPVYDPGIAFSSVLTTGLIFGSGILVGSYWNNRWGWNNRGWNNVWINQPVWHPGRPGGPPAGVWRPDRPGTRPDRPGMRPPGARPPGSRPDRPNIRPDRPGSGGPNRPGLDRPGVRPDLPSRPDRPNFAPGGSGGAGANRPNIRPDRPGGAGGPGGPGGNRPNIRPDRPSGPGGAGGGVNRPNVRPGGGGGGGNVNRPNVRPGGGAGPNRPNISNRPQGRPSGPPANISRPQARPSGPRPQARPSGPRPQARPSAPARPQARPNHGNRGGGGGAAGRVRNRN